MSPEGTLAFGWPLTFRLATVVIAIVYTDSSTVDREYHPHTDAQKQVIALLNRRLT